MTGDVVRVETNWPAELHARVQAAVGNRKLSRFVREAVEAKLAQDSAGESLRVETVELVQEADVVQDSTHVEAEASSTVTVADTEPVIAPVIAPVIEAEPEHVVGDTVTVAGIEFTKVSDDPFSGNDTPLANGVRAEFDRDTRDERTAQIADQFGLRRASELAAPEPAAPTAGSDSDIDKEVESTLAGICPECHAPLIAGECWACDM